MDAYTRRTRDWLEAIYGGPPGLPYTPHSPVRGFEPSSRYIGTYCHLFAVLREMARYDFGSCLEVGAGEGFLSARIRGLFGVRATALDLSWRVCARAREFFDLPCAVGEARQLPFADKSVDVVVSVNTLEHIADVAAVFAELERIARSAVIIGMPHARRPGQAESDQQPHAHVSMLTPPQMRDIFGREAHIRQSLSWLARPLYGLAARDDPATRPGYETLRRWPRWVHGVASRIARQGDARRTVAWLCRLEERWSRRWPRWTYESIIVRELEGARRRPSPPSDEDILRELLR
jgi:SAM-dependent methyltransferase